MYYLQLLWSSSTLIVGFYMWITYFRFIQHHFIIQMAFSIITLSILPTRPDPNLNYSSSELENIMCLFSDHDLFFFFQQFYFYFLHFSTSKFPKPCYLTSIIWQMLYHSSLTNLSESRVKYLNTSFSNPDSCKCIPCHFHPSKPALNRCYDLQSLLKFLVE